MSGIPLVLGFERGMASPLDVDFQKADITARNAIETDKRFEGMPCYVVSEGKTYTLIGGIANSNWQSVVTGSATWGSITGLIENQTDLWAELTGYQQSSFDASDFYDVSATAAYFDDTLGAVFPEGVDSSLLIKYTTPYRWGLMNLLAQISWQHGAISGGYQSYYDQNYWLASPDTWNGTTYVGNNGGLATSQIILAAVGAWNVGFRPDAIRITIDISTMPTGSSLEFRVYYSEFDYTPFDIFYSSPDWLSPPHLALGVNIIDIDLTGLSSDIHHLEFFCNFLYPTYDITNIEFLTSASGTGVEFDVSARVLNNGTATTQAFGTAVTIADTGGAIDTRYITPQSTSITAGGAPAKGCDIEIKVTRTGTTDTLTADAYLQNLRLFFDADQSNDNEAA